MLHQRVVVNFTYQLQGFSFRNQLTEKSENIMMVLAYKIIRHHHRGYSSDAILPLSCGKVSMSVSSGGIKLCFELLALLSYYHSIRICLGRLTSPVYTSYVTISETAFYIFIFALILLLLNEKVKV